jgi:alpha-glucosidase
MAQVAIAPEQVRDPFERNVPGIGVGRDGCRTPMQWTAGRYAGFSTAAPWLPLAPDFRSRNVENQCVDPGSMLNLHRRLLRLRRARPALTAGRYLPVAATGDLLLYVRELGDDRVLVALNLGDAPLNVQTETVRLHGTLLVSSHGDRDDETVDGALDLRGDEGAVIGLTA